MNYNKQELCFRIFGYSSLFIKYDEKRENSEYFHHQQFFFRKCSIFSHSFKNRCNVCGGNIVYPSDS